ncbi:MAG: methionine--tRNA ligase [Candidatus ainarchaeum sp.]|nr:methionine--tRNA ligase [Candidatus ainarchaeum sp.]
MIQIAKSKDKFYLTTAIPYVNAAPHLGHALEFIQTDAMGRYRKAQGYEVALVTGSDENSLKNVHAAEAQGITTAQLCEENAAAFRAMADAVGLSYTDFVRTSDRKAHVPGILELWRRVEKSGDLHKKKYRGLYCVGCESFYEEGELKGGVCPEHNKKPVEVEEENYFFKLSRYEKKLEELIEKDELLILPEERKNEVLSFVRGGLKDFSVSRSVERAKGWGVPVPSDASQIMYVWFDALGTYLTGVGFGTDEKRFKKFWPADVHVIGKGILRFHAVYWPAMLLSAGLPLPKRVFVHGYISVEGQKMSKSLGNIVDPMAMIGKYGVDPIRYCLLGGVPTFSDGDFSEKELVAKNNNELVANFGNFAYRTQKLIEKFYANVIPSAKLDADDETQLAKIDEYAKKISAEMEKYELRRGLELLMELSSSFNKYLSDREPWKNEAKRAQTLYVSSRGLSALAILCGPFLPFTSARMRGALGIKVALWEDAGKELVKPGAKLEAPEQLFRKIEEKK